VVSVWLSSDEFAYGKSKGETQPSSVVASAELFKTQHAQRLRLSQAQKWRHISLCLHYQVWDKRTVGSNSRPAGMFVGHTDGMTHLDPKGDGRYLISNCKDQTIKLWDLRNMMEPRQYNPKLVREEELAFRWYVLMSPQDKKCKFIDCFVHPSPD